MLAQNTIQLTVEKCGFRYVKTVNVPYSNSKEKEAVYIKEI